MAEARNIKVKLSLDSAEVTALLERVREVVREEIAAHDAKNAVTLKGGKLTADIGEYIKGMNRGYRRGMSGA